MDEHCSPGPEFELAFSQELQGDLVEALGRAYDDAAEHHDPAVGSNNATFGLNVYHFAWHRLREQAEKYEQVSAERTNNADRLYIKDFVLCSHRVGTTADADIHQSFPNNDGATTTMIEQQCLPGLEPKPEDFAGRRRYVLAHLGNPEDGLCAVYLCIPAGRYGEKIESWAFVYPVWKRSDLEDSIEGGAVQLATPEVRLPPPPEGEVDIKVHRRRKQELDDESPTD